MNYSQLVAAIQSYTENTFSTTEVNTFITQTETRVYNTVQFPALRRNVVGTMTQGNAYLSTPGDFLAAYSLAVIAPAGAYTFLLNKDVNFLREAYPTPTVQGTPKYYALFGPTTTNTVPPTLTNELSFMLAPTPDTAYSVELHYFFYPESITTASSGTTWLGDNYDPVLLYGSLVEAYTFMKGEQDMMAKYDQLFKDALAEAKRLGDGMERGDAYRSGQYRQKVV